jgi:DNA invertase Pin-like site-specific DNA recombinase
VIFTVINEQLKAPQLRELGQDPRGNGFASDPAAPRREAAQAERRGSARRCKKIHREKVTGAHNDRRELLKMLKHLAPGDVVTLTGIDRLARSTFDRFLTLHVKTQDFRIFHTLMNATIPQECVRSA